MKPNETRSAYILIDMENSFVEPEAAHCIRQAKATIPACAHSIETAREKGIPIFFVKRIYRADGSDVELTRFAAWVPPFAEAGGLFHHQAALERLFPDRTGFDSAPFGGAHRHLSGNHHAKLHPHHLLRRKLVGLQRRGAHRLLFFPNRRNPARQPRRHGAHGRHPYDIQNI